MASCVLWGEAELTHLPCLVCFQSTAGSPRWRLGQEAAGLQACVTAHGWTGCSHDCLHAGPIQPWEPWNPQRSQVQEALRLTKVSGILGPAPCGHFWHCPCPPLHSHLAWTHFLFSRGHPTPLWPQHHVCRGSSRLLSEPGSQQQVGPICSLIPRMPSRDPQSPVGGCPWWLTVFWVTLVFQDGWSTTEEWKNCWQW